LRCFAEVKQKATDPFASLLGTARMMEVLLAVAKEGGYTKEDIEEDLAILDGQRVRTVHNLRALSEQDIKELRLPPVVARYFLRIKAGGDR
jgi:hypothetical protein